MTLTLAGHQRASYQFLTRNEGPCNPNSVKESVYLILLETVNSVQNATAIDLIVVEVFQSGPPADTAKSSISYKRKTCMLRYYFNILLKTSADPGNPDPTNKGSAA